MSSQGYADMHEFSLATEILKIAKQAAITNRLNKVNEIFLKIGQFSGVLVDALTFAFEILKNEEELFKNTVLKIENIKGRLKCTQCDKEFSSTDTLIFVCPHCGNYGGNIIQGKEFEIVEIRGEGEEVYEKN